MSAWNGIDRRKFPRVNYPCLLIIREGKGKKNVLLSHTENVGVGGLCIIIKKNLKLFSPIDLELDLLDFGEHIKCKGKIVWSVRRRDDEKKKPLFYDLGVEFIDISDADRKRIEKVLGKIAKQEGAAAPTK